MTRGEIRTHVRDILGESIPGTWQDDELNRYIYLELCRHAQEALSVPTERITSSLYGVPEYVLPEDYGEMRSVRFLDYRSRPRPLPYIRKDLLLNRGNENELSSIGIPRAYYIFNDQIGFFPAPSKGPILSYEPEDFTRWFEKIYDTEDRSNYTANQVFDLTKVDGTNPVDQSRLYPQQVSISHIELYFRRMGPPLKGMIWLTMKIDGCPAVPSKAIDAFSIKSLPAAVAFDFSEDPIEVNLDPVVYTLTIHTNDTYDNFVTEQDCRGVEVGVDAESSGDPWFQLHQVKNDIAIDYYKNTVNEPRDDDETLEIPNRYRNSLIEQTLERAYNKGGYDLGLASVHGANARKMIAIARQQEKQRTLGDRIFINEHIVPSLYHDVQDGVLRGTAF